MIQSKMALFIDGHFDEMKRQNRRDQRSVQGSVVSRNKARKGASEKSEECSDCCMAKNEEEVES